jgi:hypothetical protein
MVDIDKKITFYFLLNVWKCTVFFRICICVTQNFMLISNSLMPAFRRAPKKSQKQKTTKKCTKNENTQNSHSFLALALFRGICLSRHQRIWNQHKILRYFDTHIDIFQENFFLGHNSTFWNLKMQMRQKTVHFQTFCKN